MIKIQQKKNFNSIFQFHIFQDKQLGNGSFGVVNLSIHIKTCKLYAIKIINLKKLSSNAEIKMLEKQNKIHGMLDHPHIVKLWDNIIQQNKLYMIMEYIEKGSLFSYQNTCTKFSEIQTFKYFYQTLKALKYIHNLNIIHRDIKPQNLLLDQDFNIKICDFGWATNCLLNKRNTFCGTYQYMAPQIIFENEYDHRVDIWSMGILLYQLLHGFAPFRGQNARQIKQKMKRVSQKSVSSSQCQFQDINPSERITIQEIQSSSWTVKMQKYLKIYYIENIYYKIPNINNKIFNQSFSSKSIKSPKKSQTNLFGPYLQIKEKSSNNNRNTNTKIQNFSNSSQYLKNLNFQNSFQMQVDERDRQNSVKLSQSHQKLISYAKLHTSATLNSGNIGSYRQKIQIPKIIQNQQISDIEGLETPQKQFQMYNKNNKNKQQIKKSDRLKMIQNSPKKIQQNLQYNLRQTQKSIFIEPISNYISIHELPTKRRKYIKSNKLQQKNQKKSLNTDQVNLSQRFLQTSVHRFKTCANINNNSERRQTELRISKKKKINKVVREFTSARNIKKISPEVNNKAWGKQFSIYVNLKKSPVHSFYTNVNNNTHINNTHMKSKSKQKQKSKSKSKEKEKDKEIKKQKDKWIQLQFDKQKDKEKQRQRQRDKEKQKEKAKRRQKTKDKQKQRQKSKSKSNLKQKQRQKEKHKQCLKTKITKRNTNPQLLKHSSQPTFHFNIRKK